MTSDHLLLSVGHAVHSSRDHFKLVIELYKKKIYEVSLMFFNCIKEAYFETTRAHPCG